MTIRSGSQWQFVGVFPEDGILRVGSSEAQWYFIFKDEGDLASVNLNQFSTVHGFSLISISEVKGSPNFFIKSGFLYYENTATPLSVNPNNTILVVGSKGDPVAVKAVLPGSGSPPPDFNPKKIRSTSTFSVDSSSTSSAETTMSNPSISASPIDGLPVSTVGVDPSPTKLQKRSNGSSGASANIATSGAVNAAVFAVVCAAVAVYIV